MTSATEELRRLLDEQGVEHYDGTESTLWLEDEHGYRASADELSSGRLSVHIWCDTPEQAIAATLGSGTSSSEAANPQVRCTDSKRNAPVRDREDTHTLLPCPFCGGEARTFELRFGAGWRVLCGKPFCAQGPDGVTKAEASEAWNTRAELGSGMCKYDETETIPVIRIFAKDTFDNDPLGVRIHVLECTVCGGTYEHVNGDYEYCPRCGRKCEGEYA